MSDQSRVEDEIELDRMKREIPLAAYAATRGFELDPKESSRSYVVMRRGASKIVVKRGQTKDYWVYYDPHTDQNGTIVDFVQKTLGERLSIGEIRKELRPWLGVDRPRVVPKIYVPSRAPECDRAAVAAQLALGREVATCLYLNGRGLRRETLQDERFRGTWREEADGKVLFPHQDAEGLSGFERKGWGFTGFAAGGRRSLWRSNLRSDDRRLVLTESAIDGLSCHQLDPDPRTRYASTGGAISPHQRALLADEIARMPAGSRILLAFDNDLAGQRMAADVEGLAPRATFVRHVPAIGKDWNDFLKLQERDYIRSLGLPREREGFGR